ncbi:hypothetical protein [Pseudogulbenkiania sp. MAI-1]|uniref:hypothetical protein n=1 Tax=Pseudogulbenkiania sp. MAI-1 TaxID=990370 RepID=UPI00055B10D9|nr:hypothetical protein [Pseudogulbenkiania sp. MAI-1]
MKRMAYWGCAMVSVALAGGVFYFYGFSLRTLAIALVLLICPVLVVWLTFYLAQRSEADIDESMRRHSRHDGQ